MKIFKSILLISMFISGAFAVDLDRVMRNAVLSFRDVLMEQNTAITKLTNRISNIEQQLEILTQKVDNLEKQNTNFSKSISQSEITQSYTESDINIDFNNVQKSGRFIISKIKNM